MSKQAFINSIRKGAQAGFQKYGIFPSVSIAQAILESGWGKSILATESNNLFGIKAGNDWTGKKRNYPTQEQDADGNSYWVHAYFRVYDSWNDSIEDHGSFFTSTPWRAENYKAVLNATTYREQAIALQSSGYATDKQYANKLIDLIVSEELEGRSINMVKVMLDPGHGGHDPGASANGVIEKVVALQISKATKSYLDKNYKGIVVRLTRSTDRYLTLGARTKLANDWGADLFVSNHLNAGGGVGFESFIHTSRSKASRLAQDSIQAEVIKIKGVINRGKKSANFSVLRRSTMAAVLTESLFVDTKSDANLMKQSKFVNRIATAHAKGIAIYFGLDKGSSKPTPAPKPPKVSKPKPVPKPKPTASKYTEVEGNWTGQTLVKFHRGKPVTQLQQKMANNKPPFYPDANASKKGVDGYYGTDTENMVYRYQSYNGLGYDGKAGKEVYDHLHGGRKSNKKPGIKIPVQLPTGILRRGNHGERVKMLQSALNRAGFKVGKADGKYGAKTEDGVYRLQLLYEPVVKYKDGIYGSRARKYLNNLLNK